MLGEEPGTVGGIAEGFCTAGSRRGECSGQVAAREAGGQVSAAHELMQESGVEAVAGADRIDSHNFS